MHAQKNIQPMLWLLPTSLPHTKQQLTGTELFCIQQMYSSLVKQVLWHWAAYPQQQLTGTAFEVKGAGSYILKHLHHSTIKSAGNQRRANSACQMHKTWQQHYDISRETPLRKHGHNIQVLMWSPVVSAEYKQIPHKLNHWRHANQSLL